jgi:predicted nucleic acid-binding protein
MKRTVYLETTFFSFYHDGRLSSRFRREITREWWAKERRNFNIYTSMFSYEELSVPAYPAWKKASGMCKAVPFLEMNVDVAGVVKAYITNRIMPAGDVGDAAHLAIATYHEADYLVTWNCRHLANANKFAHIRMVNRRLGLVTPEIVTPEQLFSERFK